MQPFTYFNQSFKITIIATKKSNSESFTDSVEQFTTTGVFKEKIFCQSTSSVSKELNNTVVAEHAMNANLL